MPRDKLEEAGATIGRIGCNLCHNPDRGIITLFGGRGRPGQSRPDAN